MSRLGDLIRTERLRQKMTPKQVAKKCGVAESYIMAVEAGTRIIADDQARRILKSIGLKQQTEAEFTLDDIAAKASLNKTYVITLFRRLNGVTPWEYITARRIEKSYEMLDTTDMNILEIATKCGFNNASNFNRAFRKVTGRTPSEYRRRTTS